MKSGNWKEEFAGVVARAVVELVVEPVETQPRHRVAAGEA